MSYDLWGRLRYMLSPQFDIYEQIANHVHGDVADIGCGTGFGTHLLARKAKSVIGYEVDPTALKFADRTFSNGKTLFLHGDITDLPLPGSPFDFVTMVDVIEHIEDDRTAIKTCSDILQVDGTFICSTPNKLSRYRTSDYHVREYVPVEFQKLLLGFFEDVSIVGMDFKLTATEFYNPIIAVARGPI